MPCWPTTWIVQKQNRICFCIIHFGLQREAAIHHFHQSIVVSGYLTVHDATIHPPRCSSGLRSLRKQRSKDVRGLVVGLTIECCLELKDDLGLKDEPNDESLLWILGGFSDGSLAPLMALNPTIWRFSGGTERVFVHGIRAKRRARWSWRHLTRRYWSMQM